MRSVVREMPWCGPQWRNRRLGTRSPTTRRGGLGLTIAATSFGFALVQLDVSILNVALARIGDAVGAGVEGLQWVVDAYTVTFASFMLAAGSLGDRFGARRAYMCGLMLFALASLGCGLAPGAGALIAARSLQGVGAALVVPCSLALLTHSCGCDAAARARAISLWTAAASVTLAGGPPLGGVLVDTLGWRSIFLVNLPICAAGIWLTWKAAAETPSRAGALDLAGQALALSTLLGFTGAIIEAGRLGFTAPPVIAGFLIAALCASGLLVVEMRQADPLLPLGFFRKPTFSAAALVGFVINLTLYGMIFVLGLYLQQYLGYSPIKAGLAFLPLPVVLGIANLAAGPLGARLGRRMPIAGGLLIAALGYWLLSAVIANAGYTSLLPGIMAIPAGVGVAVPTMTAALLSTVPQSRSGTAAGVLNTMRQAGGGIGVALFGALMAARGVHGIETALVASAALLGCGAVVAGLGIRQPCDRCVDVNGD